MLDSARAVWRTCWRFELLCLLGMIIEFSPAALAQQHAVHLVVRQTATQSLTLIKPTDPNFDGMLGTYFPGLSLEDGYEQAIKPFLVIVRNDNYLPAVAYAITWTPPSQPGWFTPFSAMFVNRPLMYQGATTYLRPEDIRLISPLFNVTPKEYAATPSFGRVYPAGHFPSTKGMIPLDSGVDGVVYSDGTFIGPDKTHILQRYVMARFAARDEALEAINFIKSSTMRPLAGVQLLQMLSQERQRDGRASQTNLLARYVRARGRSAQDVKRILDERGVSGLQDALQELINRQGDNQNASMFDRPYRKLSDNDPRVFSSVPSEANQP